jgi:riboflavin kinase
LIKSAHIPTLIELISLGAKDRPVAITTIELANKLGKSQQLASHHLDQFEKDGLIERIRSNGRIYVKLTKTGVSEASSLYRTLQVAFEATNESVELDGQIFSGLGEGAYYVSLPGYKKQFHKKLGFEPFPGTLNVRLNRTVDRKVRRDLDSTRGIHIDGFGDGKRTYGGAECFPALINGKVKSAVLVIERTTHDDSVLEVISPINIRQALRLKEKELIRVKIFVNINHEKEDS